jgi:hypothetical protein
MSERSGCGASRSGGSAGAPSYARRAGGGDRVSPVARRPGAGGARDRAGRRRAAWTCSGRSRSPADVARAVRSAGECLGSRARAPGDERGRGCWYRETCLRGPADTGDRSRGRAEPEGRTSKRRQRALAYGQSVGPDNARERRRWPADACGDDNRGRHDDCRRHHHRRRHHDRRRRDYVLRRHEDDWYRISSGSGDQERDAGAYEDDCSG